MIATTDWIAVDRSRALGGVDLVRACFVTRATPRHSHSAWEIGVVGSGTRLVWCRGGQHLAPAGSIVVFRPGEIHAGSPVDPSGSTYRSFLVSSAALEPDGATSSPWFEHPVIQDSPLARQLVDAHRLLEAGDGGELALVAALGVLRRRHGRPAPAMAATPRDHGAVDRVRRHLELHYARPVRLTALAKLAGLSVFHLIRVFRDATGLPPYAYLEQLRIDRAAELLRQGCPVSQVAFRTGFADQSHLTRFFKRLMGVPPGRYQRSALRAGPSAAGKIIQSSAVRVG